VAMETIHGITAAGEVITGIEVFEKAYKAVGLGWVYGFTRVPALLRAANTVYDFWARYRLRVTGRPGLKEVLEAGGGLSQVNQSSLIRILPHFVIRRVLVKRHPMTRRAHAC